MDLSVDPVWTERPSSVSRENPIGVTTTRNRRLFNDLIFPVQSDAITYRLRYLSFWAWVLQKTEDPDKETRARYEKVFFLANIAHDCPDDGHSSSGIVGATRRSNGKRLYERYDTDADAFDIADETFALTKSGGSGFDTYYQGLMQRMWILHGKTTLTPIGRQLAGAYDEAVPLEFDQLRTAVEDGIVSQGVVQQLSKQGCCCQLRQSEPERKVLTNALLANFTKTDDPTDLSFHPGLDPESLSIEAWYPQELEQGDDTTIDLESVLDTQEDTVLAEYFEGRFGVRSRASCILLLAAAERVETASATSGLDMPVIEDIRRAWEFFVHTHYFVIATEALFKAWLHGLRYWGPIATDELLQEIFDGEEYRRTIHRLLQRDLSVSVDQTSADQIWRVLDAIYYDSWFEGTIDVTFPTTDEEKTEIGETLTWDGLVKRLPSAVNANGHIKSTSDRVLHDLVQSGLGLQSDAVYARSLAAVATVMLAQLYRRWQEYQSENTYEPYRRWFANVSTSPSPSSLGQSSFETSASIEEAMKLFTREKIVWKHWAVTQEKIQRSSACTPRHMLREPDGRWRFKSMYKTSYLRQSWLRLDRLVDACYELNLTTAANRSEFRPNEHGRKLLQQYEIDP